MARKFGMFGSEQQVIDAIGQLEQAGFVPGEIRVLAKDSQHSDRIERESDVHADEMRELQATLGGDDRDVGRQSVLSDNGAIGFAPLAGAYGISGTFGGIPFMGAPLAMAAVFNFSDGGSSREAYQALGLDSNEADLCRDAVEKGMIVMIVETDESKSLLDKDGGPTLSKLGIAEAVYRRCGASRIVDGS